MSSSSNIVNISLGESNLRRCAACKYLRRRCADDCILSPYFPASLPHRFSYVHKIFGASNVARMLQILPVHERAHAADAIALEAYWRAQDPVYGSVGIISQLQHEIITTQREIARTQAQIAIYAAPPQFMDPFQLQAAAAAAADIQVMQGAQHRPPPAAAAAAAAAAAEVPNYLQQESQEEEEAVHAMAERAPVSFDFNHVSGFY